MSRPLSKPNGDYSERYLANASDRQFHDLHNATRRCHIVDILDKCQDIAYEYETDAKSDGYVPCRYCMPDGAPAIEL